MSSVKNRDVDSMSTRTLGPDPTTFEVCWVQPISGRVLQLPKLVRADPGRQTHFCATDSPKYSKPVKSFTHVHKTPIHPLSWDCCNKTF